MDLVNLRKHHKGEDGGKQVQFHGLVDWGLVQHFGRNLAISVIMLMPISYDLTVSHPRIEPEDTGQALSIEQ